MSVTQRAIDEIKAMIIRGELAAGERLPKEADLAARLGISRNSLREAVRALTLAGSSRPARATAPTSPASSRACCSSR